MFEVGKSYTGEQLRGWGFNPDITDAGQSVGGKSYTLTNDRGMRRVNAGGTVASSAASAAPSMDEYFKKAADSRQNLIAANDRISTELGLPQLRANALNLQQTLYKTPQVQKDATRGYNVNQNQQDRIIASKQAAIAPAAQLATQNQIAGEQQLTDRLKMETAYDDAELTALLTKYSAGVQLSRDELSRMHDLTMLEKQQSFQRQENDRAQQIKDAMPVELTGGSSLYYPSTGKFVTAPKISAADTGTSGVNFNSGVNSGWQISPTAPRPNISSFDR